MGATTEKGRGTSPFEGRFLGRYIVYMGGHTDIGRETIPGKLPFGPAEHFGIPQADEYASL